MAITKILVRKGRLDVGINCVPDGNKAKKRVLTARHFQHQSIFFLIYWLNTTGEGGAFMHVVVVKSPKCLQKLLKAIFHMK